MAKYKEIFLKQVSPLFSMILLCCLLTFDAYSQAANIAQYPVSPGISLNRNYNDTINILAVMVQFKPDKDTLTTGNGTFDLAHTFNDTIVDAPPHNRDYFYNHLVFLKNYYNKVSDGKLKINFTIVDKIYELPNQMSVYSPPKGNNYEKLARLASDTWRIVDSTSQDIDFSRYQCFMIFHAGAGKELNLPSIFGYDPTPYDLPSLTFDLKFFRKYFGEDYKGIPVKGGNYFIKNSLILPEMEYREISGIGGKSLIQLSLNGIIASSVGTYLGLPDLFDSKTGASAIGRFGLMDGESIFSYNGLFPPEPSAWEKIYLGWIEPVVISSGLKNVTINAHRTDGIPNNDYKIYKIPINSKEYFLVECKYRDPGKNGQKLQVWLNGNISTVSIGKDTNYFSQNGSVGMINGVVVDVEDYDWSLPSGYDYKNNILNGGLLIWHIDEGVINSKLATNSINDDINHRGVDLEEADGSQDIGRSYDMLSAGNGSEKGTPLDFWYNDLSYYNKDSLLRPVYKNVFSPASNPSSLSYDYSNNHIEISDISLQGPVMSFKVKIGDESVSLLNGFPIKLPVTSGKKSEIITSDIDGDNKDEIFIRTQDDVYCFNQDGKSILSDSSGKILQNIFNLVLNENSNKSQIIVDEFSGNSQFPNSHKISGYQYLKSARGNVISQSWSKFIPEFAVDTLNPAIYLKGNDPQLFFLAKSKNLYFDYNTLNNSGRQDIQVIVFNPAERLNEFAIKDISAGGTAEAYIKGTTKVKHTSGNIWSISEFTDTKNLVGGDFDGDGIFESALIGFKKDQMEIDLIIFKNNTSTPSIFKLFSNACAICWQNISFASIGDIDDDGKQDIVFAVFDNIYAYNFNGVQLPNFPVKISNCLPSFSALIGDIDSDKKNDIIIAAEDGRIYAINNKGKSIAGFPLTIGVKPQAMPIIFKNNTNIGLSVFGSDGYLYAWNLKGVYDPTHLPWISENANKRKTNFAIEELSKPVIKNELMPKSKTYNWPNPVYGNTTKIRYYLEKPATVKIQVFDNSGEKVAEFAGPGTGGIDNEVEWNVKDIQSGVYLGRIEAASSEGTSVVIIKIAIVK